MQLLGLIAMQDERLGFWSFPVFVRVLQWTGNNLFTFNQAFIKKHLEKSSSKTLPLGTRSIICNKHNCSRHPANVKDTEKIGGKTKNY